MKDVVRRLKDPAEQVRIDGCLALARSGHQAAPEILSQVAERDGSPRVRYAARKLIDHLQARQTVAVAPGGAADLGSDDPERRLRAATELAAHADPARLPALRAALTAEGDPRVQAALITALGHVGGEGEVKFLAPWVRDVNARVRANAVDALLEIASPLALALVFPLLQDEDHRVRANAARALALEGEAGALGVLTRMVASEKIWMRDAAAYACGVIDDERAVELLLRLHGDRNRAVREKAQKGLERFAEQGSTVACRFLDGLGHGEPPPATVDGVAEEIADEAPGIEALEDGNPKLRMNVVNAIIEADDKSRLPELVDHLSREENDFVSSRILSAVGILGKDRPLDHLELLKEYLTHPDLRTVANAIDAANRLGLAALRPRVRPFLRSRDTRIRASALIFLSGDSQVDLMRELSDMVDGEDEGLRRSAIFVVERLARRRPEVVGALLPLLEEGDSALHWDLVEALERMAAAGVAQARKLLPSAEGEELGATVLEMELIRLERATFLKRCLAFVFDNFLLGGAFFFLLLVVVGITALAASGNRGLVARHVTSNVSVVGFLYCLVFFLRDGFFGGRGLGKRWVGLRVVDVHTGGGCGFFRSLLRQATLGMPVVNVVEAFLTGLDPRGRRLIDRLLGMQVIDEKRRELAGWEKGLAIFGACFVGLFVFLSLVGLLVSFLKGLA